MRWWEIVGMEEPSGDTPSVTPVGRASSLMEGAGMGAYHSTGCLRNRGGAGDFHRPYGGRVPFIVPPGNRNAAGDFHRPYEGSGNFTFCHSSGDTPSVSFADSSLREGAGSGELFQEICNIVSVQIEGYFGILMGQVVACAGQEVGDVEGGFCFCGLEDDGGNAAGFQHQ